MFARLIPFVLVLLVGSFAQGADDGFKPLFNGEDLSGWRNPYPWGKAWVEDGAICLQADRKFFLVTDKPYGDFILEAEVMLPAEGKSNSGLMVRAHVENAGTKKARVYGYQAECDPSSRAWAGGLYDEGRRTWLHPRKGQEGEVKLVQAPLGKWIKYRIEAIGDHLVFTVNGKKTTDYRDPLDIAGYIGVQHHGEKGQIYRFRNIRIKDLGTRQWEPLFNGENLSGWNAIGGGKWQVNNGVIVGTSEASEEQHGLLMTDRTFRDFTVRCKFRAVKGNSGFYFRAQKVDDNTGVKGFQAEIEPKMTVGALYETRGRKWVVKPQPELLEKVYKPGEWTDLAVSAHGGRITTYINGQKVSELPNDEQSLREGHIALQLHGGQDMHVEYKDIEILGEPRDGSAGN